MPVMEMSRCRLQARGYRCLTRSMSSYPGMRFEALVQKLGLQNPVKNPPCQRTGGADSPSLRSSDRVVARRAGLPGLIAFCLVSALSGCVSETVRIVDMTPPEQLERVQAE